MEGSHGMKAKYLITIFTSTMVLSSFAYAGKISAIQLAQAEQQQEYPLNYQLPTATDTSSSTAEDSQQNLFSNPTPTKTTTTQTNTNTQNALSTTNTTTTAAKPTVQSTKSKVEEMYIPNTEQQNVALPKKSKADVAPTPKSQASSQDNLPSYQAAPKQTTQTNQPRSFHSTPVPIFFSSGNSAAADVEEEETAPAPAQ